MPDLSPLLAALFVSAARYAGQLGPLAGTANLRDPKVVDAEKFAELCASVCQAQSCPTCPSCSCPACVVDLGPARNLSRCEASLAIAEARVTPSLPSLPFGLEPRAVLSGSVGHLLLAVTRNVVVGVSTLLCKRHGDRSRRQDLPRVGWTESNRRGIVE